MPSIIPTSAIYSGGVLGTPDPSQFVAGRGQGSALGWTQPTNATGQPVGQAYRNINLPLGFNSSYYGQGGYGGGGYHPLDYDNIYGGSAVRIGGGGRAGAVSTGPQYQDALIDQARARISAALSGNGYLDNNYWNAIQSRASDDASAQFQGAQQALADAFSSGRGGREQFDIGQRRLLEGNLANQAMIPRDIGIARSEASRQDIANLLNQALGYGQFGLSGYEAAENRGLNAGEFNADLAFRQSEADADRAFRTALFNAQLRNQGGGGGYQQNYRPQPQGQPTSYGNQQPQRGPYGGTRSYTRTNQQPRAISAEERQVGDNRLREALVQSGLDMSNLENYAQLQSGAQAAQGQILGAPGSPPQLNLGGGGGGGSIIPTSTSSVSYYDPFTGGLSDVQLDSYFNQYIGGGGFGGGGSNTATFANP